MVRQYFKLVMRTRLRSEPSAGRLRDPTFLECAKNFVYLNSMIPSISTPRARNNGNVWTGT